MKNTRLLLTTIMLSLFIGAIANPPEPPLGKRWQVNYELSDEFDGNALDLSKWNNYHPNWKGRSPAKFMKEAVSVVDGVMQIRNYKLPVPDGNYTIGGGAVTSKSQTAYFGYYEVSTKASKTPMSTTFWMSTYGNYPGPEPCDDKYGLELDIQECAGVFPDGSYPSFTKGMHSNTHYWYTPCGGSNGSLANGNQVSDTRLVSDTFNVYGAWWIDEKEVDYYYNNNFGGNVKFRTDITDKPFDKPMRLNMVTETYDWVGAPSDAQLADDSKNTSYYDWVRVYDLIDVDESPISNNLISNGDFETGSDIGWTGWGGPPRVAHTKAAHNGKYGFWIRGAGAPEQSIKLQANTAYTLTAYAKAISGSITLGVKDSRTGVHLNNEAVVTNTEFQKYTVKFTTTSSTNYKLFYYASSATDEGYLDDVTLQQDGISNEVETVMFNEDIWFSSKPVSMTNASTFDFVSTYMSNATREIYIELKDQNNLIIKKEVIPAIAGFGKKKLSLQLDNSLSEGIEYTASIYIRPIGSSDNSNAYKSDSFSFNVTEPVDVNFIIKDKRTGETIEGAEVTFASSILFSDEKGEITFLDVPLQNHTFKASATGYNSTASTEYNFEKDTSLTIELTAKNYRLNVFFKDSVNKLPLRGFRYELNGEAKVADSEGKTRLTLPYGSNFVNFNHSNYGEVMDTLKVQSTDNLTLHYARKFTDVKFMVKLDGDNFANLNINFAGEDKLTSSVGIANFSNVPTLKNEIYTFSDASKTWMVDSAHFYNDTTVQINLTSTGIRRAESLKEQQIYPNPVRKKLHLKSFSPGSRISIFDINGREILHQIQMKKDGLDVSDFHKGVYIFTIQHNGIHSTGRFIKM